MKLAGSKQALFGLSVAASFLFLAGCGYTTRPGLAPNLRTVFVKPFTNIYWNEKAEKIALNEIIKIIKTVT